MATDTTQIEPADEMKEYCPNCHWPIEECKCNDVWDEKTQQFVNTDDLKQ